MRIKEKSLHLFVCACHCLYVDIRGQLWSWSFSSTMCVLGLDFKSDLVASAFIGPSYWPENRSAVCLCGSYNPCWQGIQTQIDLEFRSIHQPPLPKCRDSKHEPSSIENVFLSVYEKYFRGSPRLNKRRVTST